MLLRSREKAKSRAAKPDADVKLEATDKAASRSLRIPGLQLCDEFLRQRLSFRRQRLYGASQVHPVDDFG
jgi:hypothetical protein